MKSKFMIVARLIEYHYGDMEINEHIAEQDEVGSVLPDMDFNIEQMEIKKRVSHIVHPEWEQHVKKEVVSDSDGDWWVNMGSSSFSASLKKETSYSWKHPRQTKKFQKWFKAGEDVEVTEVDTKPIAPPIHIQKHLDMDARPPSLKIESTLSRTANFIDLSNLHDLRTIAKHCDVSFEHYYDGWRHANNFCVVAMIVEQERDQP